MLSRALGRPRPSLNVVPYSYNIPKYNTIYDVLAEVHSAELLHVHRLHVHLLHFGQHHLLVYSGSTHSTRDHLT